MIKAYYHLTKPGIVYGNAITAAAGFLFASNGSLDAQLFIASLFGLSLIIASACVINNILDIDIDALMARTQQRPLPANIIKPASALNFAAVLLGVGVSTLCVFSTPLALMVALFGFFIYVFVYTVMKRVSTYATHVGAIAGATPPVVGYAAVTNSFDIYALLLFVILCLWQMSHFFSIALFRRFEYAAASIPVLPIMKGIYRTKLEILVYTLAFSAAGLVLVILTNASTFTRFILGLSAAIWSGYAVGGFLATDTSAWAKKVFLWSLVALLGFSVAISLI